MSALMMQAGSTLWSGVNALARMALERGWIRAHRLPVRVISVGNIQAGGAGKTPLVARIACEAAERGKSVAIFCRGYGGLWEKGGGVIAPGTRAPAAEVCGDEAALLSELAPRAWIGVGADRIRSFEECDRQARESGGSGLDLVVLDDGFQHWRIAKDVEIVALTSRSSREILYRDRVKVLSKAHLLIWTKGETEPAGLRRSGVPFARIRYQIPKRQLEEPVLLVTGLGDGDAVRRDLEKSGYVVARHLKFADHTRYDSRQVNALLNEATQAGQRVVITGKDWVKWRELGVRQGLGNGEVFVIEPELHFEFGREHWEKVLWANG